ncbi:LacI family transcriptional regulator [bacterium]|nr:MAG: LacI family transcriptional regulator [bacterium]
MKNTRRINTLATLDDIAQRVKVSRVTVSKALRGHPDISDKTARMVRKVAEEIGYRPNIIARSLSARRSNMIGLVVPKIAHFFFGSVIEGIYNAAFSNNYETILTVSQENPDRERRHLQTLVSMRVDGIIISVSQGTRDQEIFQWIRKLGVPLLFVDRRPSPPPEGFSSVLVDDKGATFKAIEHAISIGYRKIACIGGDTRINIGKERTAGFEAAMKAHGLPVEKRWVVPGGFSKETGYDAVLKLHAERQLPELIFAMTYPVALGVYEAAKELGLSIPEDVDVISFGDSDVSRVISPALSCVRQPSHELGTKGVEMMLNILAHPESAQEQHLVLPADFIVRETCTGKNVITATGRGKGTAQ